MQLPVRGFDQVVPTMNHMDVSPRPIIRQAQQSSLAVMYGIQRPPVDKPASRAYASLNSIELRETLNQSRAASNHI